MRLLILIVAFLAFGGRWYASYDGSDSGDGTFENPWSEKVARIQFERLSGPNDTLFVTVDSSGTFHYGNLTVIVPSDTLFIMGSGYRIWSGKFLRMIESILRRPMMVTDVRDEPK